MSENSNQMRQGPWRLSSFPTEFAVTIEQYQDPRPTVQPKFSSQSENAAALELFTDSGLPERPEWYAFANCLGAAPGLFFTERGQNAEVREAKAVCAGCVVRDECLDYALAVPEKFGVWGGLSERERRRIRSKRLRDARDAS